MEMVGAQAWPTENMERLEKMQLVAFLQDASGETLNGPNVVKHVGVEGAQEAPDSTEGPLAEANERLRALVIHRRVKHPANGASGKQVSVARHVAVELLVAPEP